MSGDIYLAASAALAYEKRLEVVANNLANLNTAGFKRDNVSFQAYMVDNAGSPAQANPPYPQAASPESFWVEYQSSDRFLAGFSPANRQSLRPGGQRQGFFQRPSPRMANCTRAAATSASARRACWSARKAGRSWATAARSGWQAETPTRRALDVTVGEDGVLQVNGNKVGRLRVSDFPTPDGLSKVNGCYFKPGADQGAPEPMQDFQVAQGFLEMANVEAVQLMTEMIEIHRGYQSYQRVIQAIDDLNSKSISEVSRTS